MQLALHGNGNAARLLTNDNGQTVGLLGNTKGSTVAQSQFFGNVEVMTHWQDTSCGLDMAVRNNHGTIVQG